MTALTLFSSLVWLQPGAEPAAGEDTGNSVVSRGELLNRSRKKVQAREALAVSTVLLGVLTVRMADATVD